MTQNIEIQRIEPVLRNWFLPFSELAPTLLTSMATHDHENGQHFLESGQEMVWYVGEAEQDKSHLFDPENLEVQALFGELWLTNEVGCRAVLERSKWTAEMLRYYAEGTNLLVPGGEYGPAEAAAVLQWLFAIVPVNGEYQYQSFDTQFMTQEVQQENVYKRILPHSYAAGLVAYSISSQINEKFGEYGVHIDAYKQLIINFMHDSQRFVTHNVTVHDELLLRVLAYAGLDPSLATESIASVHPRILDINAETLTQSQLEILILFMGDALTKADPESRPFETADGQPHFRKVAMGPVYIIDSLLHNYTNGHDLSEVLGQDHFTLLATILGNNPKRHQHAVADIELLQVVPEWLATEGINVQEIMDAVEPQWAALLTELVQNGRVPEFIRKDWGIEYPDSFAQTA